MYTPNLPSPAPAGNVPEEMLDLKKLLFRFLRNWYWLLLGLIIGLSIAYTYLRYSTTIYNVSSTIFITGKSQGGFSQEKIIAELGGDPGMSRSNVANELQILRSGNLMRAVVDSLQLNVQYFIEGRIKDSEIYKNAPIEIAVLLPRSPQLDKTIRIMVMDEQDYTIINSPSDSLVAAFGRPVTVGGLPIIIRSRDEILPGTIFRIELRNTTSVARAYAGKLRLQQEEQSDIIRLGMEDAVPEKVADIMQMLVRVYNQRTLLEKTEAGQNTLRFIDERLRFITDELYDVELQVEGLKERNDMAVDLSARANTFLSQLSTLDQAKSALELERNLLHKIKAYVAVEEHQMLPVSTEILGGVLPELVKQYNGVLFERDNLLEVATTQNPVVSTYEEQLTYLKKNILLAIQTKEESQEAQFALIERQIAPLEQQIARVPSSERQLLQIMRQQQIKEQLFLFLLQKREEIALSIAAQTADVQLLDQPVNTGMVSPNVERMYLLYALLGLAIPGAIIFLLHYLDNKVRSREDIEEISRIPFLGNIIQHKKTSNIVVYPGSRSSIAELFRLLRTNLSYNAAGKENKVIMVTSSLSGEGKSFVAINLGASLALSGKKVLLLGLDLRKPKLHMYLTGHQAKQGITNLLVGEINNSNQLLKTVPDYDNLCFIGCGPLPPNPAELLMTARMQELMTRFRLEYDKIIIDLPPVGLVTDALLLAKLADQTIVVTRFGYTIRPHIKMLDELYQKGKLPRMGVLLNGVKKGQYYTYGGNYGYGYGYYSDDAQKSWWKFWK